MVAENFNLFTESDALGRITVTSSRASWTDMRSGDDQIFLSSDKGTGFFDGSFVHTLTISHTASEKGASFSGFWVMSNDLLDIKGLRDGGKDALYVQSAHPNSPDIPVLTLFEVDGGADFGDPTGGFNLTTGVTLYLTITRDETVGSFGEIKLQVYSDAQRTTLVETQSFNLHSSKKDFRYVMVGVSEDSAFGGSADQKKSSGFSEDLDLMGATQGVTPQVSTQAPTAITATTATGNGTIVDLGLAAVTAHGVVWDTSPIDTSVVPGSQPNSTDEGAGSVGPFTSNITGLTGGLIYYKRAYATNSFGTTYGDGFQWKAGATYSVKKPGTAGVKGEEWHYIGLSGTEYALKGEAVL